MLGPISSTKSHNSSTIKYIQSANALFFWKESIYRKRSSNARGVHFEENVLYYIISSYNQFEWVTTLKFRKIFTVRFFRVYKKFAQRRNVSVSLVFDLKWLIGVVMLAEYVFNNPPFIYYKYTWGCIGELLISRRCVKRWKYLAKATVLLSLLVNGVWNKKAFPFWVWEIPLWAK